MLKYLPLATLTAVLGMGIGLAKFLIAEAQEKERDRQLWHSDPVKVLEAEQHIDQVEEDFKKRMEFQMHVDQMTHELLETAKELREQRKQDSILRIREAVTQYQMKRNVDSLVLFWKEYNSQAK